MGIMEEDGEGTPMTTANASDTHTLKKQTQMRLSEQSPDYSLRILFQEPDGHMFQTLSSGINLMRDMNLTKTCLELSKRGMEGRLRKLFCSVYDESQRAGFRQCVTNPRSAFQSPVKAKSIVQIEPQQQPNTSLKDGFREEQKFQFNRSNESAVDQVINKLQDRSQVSFNLLEQQSKEKSEQDQNRLGQAISDQSMSSNLNLDIISEIKLVRSCLQQLEDSVAKLSSKINRSAESAGDQQISILQQTVREVERAQQNLGALRQKIVQSSHFKTPVLPQPKIAQFSNQNAVGLGKLKSTLLEFGKERLISLVNEDIGRLRRRNGEPQNPMLSYFLSLLKNRFIYLAKNKIRDELPNTIASRRGDKSLLIEVSPEKTLRLHECKVSDGWDLTGPKVSVNQKLGSLSDQQLCHQRRPNEISFGAQDRVCWESPLTDSGEGGLFFQRIIAIADTQWLLQRDYDQWNESRNILRRKIGRLSEEPHDEYFLMLFKRKITATSLVRRVYAESHHLALLKKFWKSGRDRFEMGYLLSGLMSWLNDQRIATLYVFARPVDVDFYTAMRFSAVHDHQELERVKQYGTDCCQNEILMSIRLPSWHVNEPYKLDFGTCTIRTAESEALRILHSDLHETGAKHLIRHMAVESFFRKAHKNDVNSFEEANPTDQYCTPSKILKHVSETVKIPVQALYDPYLYNAKWKNGHHFNAMQKHSTAAKGSFINPPYSIAACSLLTHAYQNIESGTSAVFLIEQQSVDNSNVKWVYEALSTNICAGHVAFKGYAKAHKKSMTLHYMLSPELLGYREWLRQRKYRGESRRIPDSMRMKTRQLAKRDIALKLLKQGASYDIVSNLAKMSKNKVAQLAKTLKPVFRVSRGVEHCLN